MVRKFLNKLLAGVSIDKKTFESDSVFIIFSHALVNELDYFFCSWTKFDRAFKIGF